MTISLGPRKLLIRRDDRAEEWVRPEARQIPARVELSDWRRYHYRAGIRVVPACVPVRRKRPRRPRLHGVHSPLFLIEAPNRAFSSLPQIDGLICRTTRGCSLRNGTVSDSLTSSRRLRPITRYSDRSGPTSALLTRAERRLASSTDTSGTISLITARCGWSCAPTGNRRCLITQRATRFTGERDGKRCPRLLPRSRRAEPVRLRCRGRPAPRRPQV